MGWKRNVLLATAAIGVLAASAMYARGRINDLEAQAQACHSRLEQLSLESASCYASLPDAINGAARDKLSILVLAVSNRDLELEKENPNRARILTLNNAIVDTYGILETTYGKGNVNILSADIAQRVTRALDTYKGLVQELRPDGSF